MYSQLERRLKGRLCETDYKLPFAYLYSFLLHVVDGQVDKFIKLHRFNRAKQSNDLRVY